MKELLQQLVSKASGYAELRHHVKRHLRIRVEKGKIEEASSVDEEGVAVRALVDGSWGFACTARLDEQGLAAALDEAVRGARISARQRRRRAKSLAPGRLAQGDYRSAHLDSILKTPLEAKIELAMDTEQKTRRANSAIRSASCRYEEIYEEKTLATSDGANAHWTLVRPQFYVMAFAEKAGQIMPASRNVGVTGDWQCLFRHRGPDEMVDTAAKTAVELLSAGHASGGRATVILAPSIVGLLTHEAIGHPVEADFVLAGSVAAGKVGQRVASELITLCDSGTSEYHEGAAGTLPVDDEGLPTQRTVIIKNGILQSYLHNRETAAHFGVAPTGNARAWSYRDEPIIRMRNTYIEPGQSTLEEMIAQVPDGYFLDGPLNGQADSTAEFTFGVQEARRIRNGKLDELLRGIVVSGQAFHVLSTVDAVSRDFRWDMGAGYCGKGQPAKVDAGGPYLRCRAIIGGRQGR